MAEPRYAIGIDLGTTNSALAWVPLGGEARPEDFAITQWETPASLSERPTLPSFLYLPAEEVASRLRGGIAAEDGWIIGRLARRAAGEHPERVVHSAKSWLCHHAADRTAAILPWGSDELGAERKLSPVRASALILLHLRRAWDARFARTGAAFDAQRITITVPASFDAAAQQLTLAAAREAGFPEGVRLLEEPQAAFYHWLERHDLAHDLWDRLPGGDGPRHVLVVDIGGGTSDFSLFELRRAPAGTAPGIARIAVSDHILLGGDNMDLALARALEARLAGGSGALSGGQWEWLVAASRDLKETALTTAGPPDEPLAVALPGRGSRLLAEARTAALTRAELEALLLDGFFPACDAEARPYRGQAALREWGLPYAADSAITRHLAAFLAGRPRVDAVLFNGGALRPPLLRARLREQIAAWQGGAPPLVLENDAPELAVSRGAARHGAGLPRRVGRIEGGSAHAVFLEVQGGEGEAEKEQAADRALLCLLPRGALPETVFEITNLPLELRIGRPVSFRAYSSAHHRGVGAGDLVAWHEDAFRPLPPLQTVVRVAESSRAAAKRTVSVHLASRLNALGLLQVSCISAEPGLRQSWPIEFNLRPHEQAGSGTSDAGAATAAAPNATAAALDAARARIGTAFARAPGKGGRFTAASLFRQLEADLGAPRHEWNAALVRALWPALHARQDGRRLSAEHEEAWLMLAGFLLRPGFGVAGDEHRMDELWQVHERGPCFPVRRIQTQEYILWRRVAGGLTRERQERLLEAGIARLRDGKAPAELVRLAGALELVPRERKAELARRFMDTAATLARAKGDCAPYLAALGRLLSRTPLHAGPDAVLPPELVEHAYAAFRDLDWAAPELVEMQALFLRAARVVGDRSLDVPKPLRGLIAGKLERAGVAPLRTAKLREFVPVGRSDRAGLFDESLPPGLVLGTAARD